MAIETDLQEATLDLATIKGVANGFPNQVVRSRLGRDISTLAAVIADIATFIPRGNWVTATNYALKDLVVEAGVVYVVVVPHVSGVFATDLAAGKLAIYQGAAKSQVDALEARVDNLYPEQTATKYFYGDSITAGFKSEGGSPVFSIPDSWVYKVCDALGWLGDYQNRGISGGTVADWSMEQLQDHVCADNQITTILPGVNDLGVYGSAQNVLYSYELALGAGAAYAAIPNSKKKFGDSAAITYAGDTPTAVPVFGHGRYMTAAGSTASFRVEGAAVYICTLQQNGFAAPINVNIDGRDYGVYSFADTGLPAANIGGFTYAPALIRIAGLGDGDHDVILTNKQTGGSATNMYVLWVAGSGDVAHADTLVMLGNTLRRGEPYNYFAGNEGYTREGNRQFNLISAKIASMLASDGLPVVHWNATAGWDIYGTPASDTVHPPVAGMDEIADSYLRTLMGRRNYGSDTGGVTGTRAENNVPTPFNIILGQYGDAAGGGHTYDAALHRAEYVFEGAYVTLRFNIVTTAINDAEIDHSAFGFWLPFFTRRGMNYSGYVTSHGGVTLPANCHGLIIENVAGDNFAVIRFAMNDGSVQEIGPADLAEVISIKGSFTFRPFSYRSYSPPTPPGP